MCPISKAQRLRRRAFSALRNACDASDAVIRYTHGEDVERFGIDWWDGSESYFDDAHEALEEIKAQENKKADAEKSAQG